MRTRWSDQEIADLSLPWTEFRQAHPHRTYDSYEVKRRRVNGGSAGTAQARAESAERARTTLLVAAILELIEAWAQDRRARYQTRDRVRSVMNSQKVRMEKRRELIAALEHQLEASGG